MGTLEIIIVVMSLLLIVSCVGLYNMLKKYEDAENIILKQDEVLVVNKNILQNTIDNMRTIDSKGGFESDDEVGSIFKALLKEIESLEQNNI
jgi:hypothetical protein